MNETASRWKLMEEQERLEERCWALRLHEKEERLRLREKAVEFKESLEGNLEERLRVLQEKEEKLRFREMALKFKEDLDSSLEERWKLLRQKEEALQSMEQQAQEKACSLQQREEELKSRDVIDKQRKRVQERGAQLDGAESALLARQHAFEEKLLVCSSELRTCVETLQEGARSWDDWLGQATDLLEASSQEGRAFCSRWSRFIRRFRGSHDPDPLEVLKEELHSKVHFGTTAAAVANTLEALLHSLDGIMEPRSALVAASVPRTLEVHGCGDVLSEDRLDTELRKAEAQFYRMMCASSAERRAQLKDFKVITLVDIVRIPAAMAAFEGRLKREKTRLGAQPTLRFGFHGTDDRGLAGILRHGFKIHHPRLGINGSSYGRGIYLAPRPWLAMKFAKTSGCTKIIMAVYMDVEGVNHHRTDDDGGALVLSDEDLVYPKYVLHLK